MLSPGLWLLLTFSQDACTSQFLFATENLIAKDFQVFLPLALTLMEVCMCLALLKADNQQGWYGSIREPLCLIVCCHAYGVFLTNIWFQLEHPEFGIIGAYTEPIICAVLMLLCTGTPIKFSLTMPMVIVAFGFAFLSTNTATLSNANRTVLLQVLLGIFFILRNICVNFFHEEGVKIVLRSRATLSAFFVSSNILFIAALSCAPDEWIVPLVVGYGTCLFHVASTYVICAWAIPMHSLLTISVLRAVAVLVESYCTMTSSRPSLATGGLASCLLIIGLGFYFRSAAKARLCSSNQKIVSPNEMMTRIQFLLFAASVVGVVFYGLQPRVSERDLQTLSYVGLDQIIRKLLSIDMPPNHEH